jgi:hypothetical protein
MLGRQRRGLSSIFLFILLVVMTLFCTLAVDYGRVKLAEGQLQDAADSGARYGAAGLWKGIAEVRARVAAVGSETNVDGQTVSFDATQDVEFGRWDSSAKTFTVLTGANQSSANAVRVTAQRIASRGNGLNGTFLSAFGSGNISRKASAIAGFGTVDVQIVQDVTGSFGEEIADAKTGDKAVVDWLYDNGKGESQVGLVTFNGTGSTLCDIKPIKGNHGVLISKVNSIAIDSGSGTDIAAGLETALNNYNSSAYVPSQGATKAVILVSDGEPNASSRGAHPGYTDAQLLTLAQQFADQLWAKKVHVYVVFFNRENSTTAANNIKTLIRGNGYFVSVTDASKLPTELASMAKRLPVQILK